MKPITPRLYLLASIVLAILVFFLPWAFATFRVGESGTLLSLPVHLMDPSIKIDDCPRAWVAGLSLTLNIWVWLGRVVYVVPFLLWIAFLAVLIRKKHLVEALIGLAGIGLIVVALMATQPIIECLWTEFPPTLVFVNPWQISSIAALCSLGSLAAGIQANLTLRRIRVND